MTLSDPPYPIDPYPIPFKKVNTVQSGFSRLLISEAIWINRHHDIA